MPPSPLLGAAKSDGKPFTAHLYILRPRSQHFFFLSLLNVVKFPNTVEILNFINPFIHLANLSIHTHNSKMSGNIHDSNLTFGDSSKVTSPSSLPSQPLSYVKPADTVFYLAVTAPHTDKYEVHGQVRGPRPR